MTALAQKFSKGFFPLRKAEKLPPPKKGISYKLKYGEARIERDPGSGKVIIIDDVLATGWTLEASRSLCEESGYQVVDLGQLINLTFLNSMKFKGQEIKSLIQY